MKFAKPGYRLTIVVLVALLSACGGGGGSDDDDDEPVAETSCILGASSIGECQI